jgi:hypothetical protein
VSAAVPHIGLAHANDWQSTQSLLRRQKECHQASQELLLSHLNEEPDNPAQLGGRRMDATLVSADLEHESGYYVEMVSRELVDRRLRPTRC